MADDLEALRDTEELPQEDAEPANDGRESDSHEGEGEGKDSGNIEKRLKDTQTALHKVFNEKKELELKLAELSGKVDILSGREAKTEEDEDVDPLSYLEDADAQDVLLDDPKNVVKAIKGAQLSIVKLLEMRDKALREETQRLLREELEKSRMSDDFKDKIAELKKDPDYAKLPDSVLTIIAKKELGGNRYRGGPGRGGGERSKGKTDLERATEAELVRIYGKDFLKDE